MGFAVLCALGAFIAFPANASLVDTKTYGSSRSKAGLALTELNRSRSGLKFAHVESSKKRKTNYKANDDIKRQRVDSQQDKENAQMWAVIQARVTPADDCEYFTEVEMTSKVQQEEKRELQRKQRKESWTKEDNDDFFAKLYEADKVKSEKKMLQQRARVQQERQAELAKRQAELAKRRQEEKDKKSEQNRLQIIAQNTRIVLREEVERQKKQKEKDANTKVLSFKSQYAQNLHDQSVPEGAHNRGRHDTAQNALHQVYTSIAEQDYAKAYEQINGDFRQELSSIKTIRALGLIGSAQGMAQDPQKLYQILHSQEIGVLFPHENLDKCALHFAQQAGNELYLDFAQSQ